MQLFIFKTNISSKKGLKVVETIFNNHPVINDWNIDREDIDKVLRIEASGNLTESDVINMIQTQGFYCEVLTD